VHYRYIEVYFQVITSTGSDSEQLLYITGQKFSSAKVKYTKNEISGVIVCGKNYRNENRK
jgi:hypothetical protein